MAFNPFIGWTKSDLETQLRSAQEELASGKQITSSSVGDASFTLQSEMGVRQRIELILRALNRLDPVTYPIDQIVSVNRAKIASPDFR